MLLLGGLVADGADLHHPLRGDRARAGRGPLLLDEGVVRLLLGVGASVQEAEGGGGVLKRADVAEEGGVVGGGNGALAELKGKDRI